MIVELHALANPIDCGTQLPVKLNPKDCGTICTTQRIVEPQIVQNFKDYRTPVMVAVQCMYFHFT